MGLSLQATPGGLNASLDNAFSSEVEAALVPALRPDAALRNLGFIMRPPTPQKLQAVLLQLGAEPLPLTRVTLAVQYLRAHHHPLRRRDASAVSCVQITIPFEVMCP